MSHGPSPDPALWWTRPVELSVIEGKSFYAFMDDARISENIFMDSEEPQVQPKTSAAATISRPNFDCDIPVIVNNDSEVQPSIINTSAAPSNQFYTASPKHPTKKTSTQKSTMWLVWLHHIIWKAFETKVCISPKTPSFVWMREIDCF